MATKAIVVTLGLALPDKTWVEKIVKFDWNSESDDLAEIAMNHWVDQNIEEANRIHPTGWWVIFHEWADGEVDEERPDRPCDPDCLRRLAGNDSVECTCSRSNDEDPSKVVVREDDIVGIFNALEYACSFISANREMDQDAKNQLLNAYKQCGRYTSGEPSDEPSSAADLTAESNDPRSHAPVDFKIDEVQVRIKNDMRVEYKDRDFGLSLIVVLSHEGIIMDVWKEGHNEPVATLSSTYEESLNEMLE